MPDQFYVGRVRRVQKAVTTTPSAGDFITVQGPCTEIIIDCRGTTDAYTVDVVGGLLLTIMRMTVSTNKRGTIMDMSGIEMDLISRCFFNTAAKTETAGGAAGDGFSLILPIGLDPDELATFNFQFGSLADRCSTGNLGGAGYVEFTLRMSVIVKQPKTYWGFRWQDMGASGVIGATARFTQPQIPIIPGFALVGGAAIAGITSRATALANNTLAQIIVTQADDYLIDDFTALLQTHFGRRIYNALPVGYHIWRHVPLANNDATQLTIVNGATATIAPSRVCYIYQSGQIAPEMAVGASVATGAAGEPTGIPQPQRELPVTQQGPALKSGQVFRIRR